MTESGGWQNIASAPKDGTRIILADFSDICAPFVTGAYWLPAQYLINGEPGEWVDPADNQDLNITPTHWMPLHSPVSP